MRKFILALALAACVPAVAAAQETQGPVALTEHQIRTRLAEQGYDKVNDLKFSDGVWHADARSADGNRVQVRLDPRTGNVFANELVARLSERDIRASLSAAGYTNIHDVDYEDGLWNAEADDPSGKDVELKINPNNGKVIGAEND
ncbi:PepSY domain-containing protein [Lysobacter firmicutimachus]|uniref:PepSY domain-containing protein n=1 Tax=Lysobacter firmicutimachus TaxID=1792846 RepID=A0AAU8MTJ4_9GAMM|nr:PepSY domain-containing protein [Lysobacter antibioticus]